MTNAADFLMSRGAPGVKWELGKQIQGKVESVDIAQQRDFDTGEPKAYPDGNPMLQLVVSLSGTGEHDADLDDDDGRRRLFAPKRSKDPLSLWSALRDAAKRAESNGIEIGGVLTVKCVGTGEPTRRGAKPPWQFKAKFDRPAVSIFTDEEDDF